MTKKFISFVVVFFLGAFCALALISCQSNRTEVFHNATSASGVFVIPSSQEVLAALANYKTVKRQMILKYAGRVPKFWGDKLLGVKTTINTREKVLALTFDACGGKGGNGYDAKLIKFLKANHIKATLFISGTWIAKHPVLFQMLANWPDFDIENHGFRHRPLSVTGRSIFKIGGTQGIGEIVEEVEQNALRIWKLTGKKPKFFRSGTLYSDEIGVQIVGELGEIMVSGNVEGDGGAKFSKQKIMKQLLTAQNGSIILMHFNHPEGDTAEGIISAIPLLQARGYTFIRLIDEGKKN